MNWTHRFGRHPARARSANILPATNAGTNLLHKAFTLNAGSSWTGSILVPPYNKNISSQLHIKLNERHTTRGRPTPKVCNAPS